MWSYLFFKKNKKGGFTIIELIVVVAIIAILSSLTILNFNKARQNSRDSSRVQALKQIQLALGTYYERTGVYPLNELDDEILLRCSTDSDFLEDLISAGLFAKIEKDPLNKDPHKFAYALSLNKDKYILTAVLENNIETMQNDGGLCDNYYEVGPWKNNSDAYDIFKLCTSLPDSLDCN